MALTIVVYDLKRPGQNYPDLIEKLESYPVHWHCQQSVWLVGTTETELELAKVLQPFLDDTDKLFVSSASSSSAWVGYSQSVTNWLQKHL